MVRADFISFFPLVVMITKGIMICYVTVKVTSQNAITMGYDNDKFRVALSLLMMFCHLLRLSCFLSVDLLLQADLWAKISPVRIPVAAKTPDKAPAPIPMTYTARTSFAQPDMSQFRKPDNAEPVMSQSVVEPECHNRQSL